MSGNADDVFGVWNDLMLAGVRAYSRAMLAGLDMGSRMAPPVPTFPAPAILRHRPAEVWPAAGSFGGGTNAVAAWTEMAGSMMGVQPAQMPGQMLNPFAWMMPQAAPSFMPPWLGGMMGPAAALAPMAMGSAMMPWLMPRPAFGWPMAPSGFGWPLSGFSMPQASPVNLMDPFGLMKPMLEAFSPKPQHRSYYH